MKKPMKPRRAAKLVSRGFDAYLKEDKIKSPKRLNKRVDRWNERVVPGLTGSNTEVYKENVAFDRPKKGKKR